MNERIRKLIRTKSAILFPGTDTVDCQIDDIEKFAELLVQECIGLCMNVNGDLPRTEPLVAASIKKHFGIE